MSSAKSPNLPEIQSVLLRCRRQIRVHNGIAGMATLLTIALAFLAFATLSDFALGLSSPVRAVSLLLFAVVLGAVIWRSLVRPFNSGLPEDQLGAAVDLSCPEMQEGLSTLISVQREDATSSEAGSELMRARLKEEVFQRLTHVSDATFVDTERLKKRCGIAGLTVIAALIPFLAWPSASRLLLQRFAQPFANLSTVSNLFFEVEDGNRVVAKGSDAIIRATPKWRSKEGERPEEVWLKITSEAGTSDRLTMSFDEVAGQFTASLPQIQESLNYTIIGGGVESESYSLTVVDAPEISSAVLIATPPAYSGMPIQTIEGMIEEVDVFERSEMLIQLQFSKPVESAALIWTRRDQRPLDDVQLFDREFDHVTGEEVIELDPDAPLTPAALELKMRAAVELSADKTSGVLRLEADVGGDFHFELTDDVGLTNPDYLDRVVTVIYDQPPQLSVQGIENLERYRKDDIVPVNALATDDIGLGALELQFYVNDQAAVRIGADHLNVGDARASEAFRIRLEELNVEDGDVVRIRVRCEDERPIPAPHVVWSDEFNIEIDRNAPPPAARAMERETKQMISALKELERQLESDQLRASELEQDARDGWTEDGRDQAQRLSEKEQQQGRVMEMIGGKVASHPLMQDAARQLMELSPQLSDEIPRRLETASAQERNLAADSMRRAGQELSEVRQALSDIIADVEERAELEKDLAELNRLALEAQDVAEQANELQQDRHNDENKPAETSEQDWQQQLNDRAEQLNQDRNELTSDIENLLDKEKELLKAAQQAQMNRLKEIQEAAGEIGKQQERVAQAAAQEAAEASRDLFRSAEEMEQLKQQTRKLQQDVEAFHGNTPPDAGQKIDQAQRDVRQGDLQSPQAALKEAREDLAKIQKQAETALQDASPEEKSNLEQQIRKAKELSQSLSSQQEQIAQAQSSRTFDTDRTPQQEAPKAVDDVLKRVDELSAMADAQSRQLSEAGESEDAQTNGRDTAEQAREAKDSASASQFQEAAQQLREASAAASQTARELRASQSESATELSSEVENLKNELTRTASMLDDLERQPQTQASARQSAQQSVAKKASTLPENLADLADRMELDALQMPQQAKQQTAQAQELAEQASEQSNQAASEMKNAQFRQASESGQHAAEQLQQMAGVSGQSAPTSSEESMVPEDVGESVADALQSLQQAAEAMQQEGGQPQESGGDQNAEQGGQNSQQGEPGAGEQAANGTQSQSGEGSQDGQQQGQQGQGGQPSSESLKAAAEALQQAASNALPGQFNPNQSPETQQAGSDGMGNPAQWDGMIPDGANDQIEGSRNWGQIVDEIDSETLDNARVGRDSTYESLIRMYFRELARSADR